MRRKTKPHYFNGFTHCGSQKIFMIEGQGTKSPAFTTYKSAITIVKCMNFNRIVYSLQDIPQLQRCVQTAYLCK